ncbi:MAG: hypothetical protein AAFQ94_11405 [Bacteroidota bacterium]
MKISHSVHLIAWLVVSVVFMVLNGLLPTDGFPLSPQFGDFQFQETIAFIQDGEAYHRSSLDVLFIFIFVTDFIWALLLLTLLYRVAINKLQVNNGVVLLVLLLFALFFDYWENTIYLIGKEPELLLDLSTVALLKNVCYAFFLMGIIHYVIRYLVDDAARRQLVNETVRNVWRFFQQSFISLIIILIIFILLTSLDQGASVIIELTMNPTNLMFTFLLLMFFAIVLSHYPSYLRAVFHENQDEIKWHMENFIIQKGKTWPFGLVRYRSIDGQNEIPSFKEKRLTKVLRHSLGLLVLSALMYIFLFIGKKFEILPAFFAPELAYVVFIGCVLYYNHLFKKLDERREKGESVEPYKNYFYIHCVVTMSLMILSVVFSATLEWSLYTIVSSIFTILAMMFLYMHFRLVRGYLIKTTRLIRVIAGIGFVTIMMLVIINIHVDLAVEQFNPLIILILYLINIYGFTMLILKHIFYYWDKDNKDEGTSRVRFAFMTYLLPVIVTFAMIWSFFIAPKQLSDHHTIQAYTLAQNEQISEREFLSGLISKNKNKHERFFQVSAYGGGLKANLWTMLTLRQITQKDPEFLDRTISMSGTSGGMMGIGNFAALHVHDKNSIYRQKMDSIIFAIGRFDHLSVDFTYLLGKDLLKEFIPRKEGYNGSDRSAKSMEFYSWIVGVDGKPRKSYDDWLQKQFAKITGRTRVKERMSFRNRYCHIFKQTGYFPAIFINSYAISGSQGVALSITGSNQNRQSINLLNEPKQISYFGALSTTNRFPVFSPTAKIEGKGNFLDGGYLDNSGLTSTLGFKKHLLSQKGNSSENSDLIDSLGLSDQNIRQVIVNSGKVDYIKSLFDDCILYENGIEVEQVGEVSSIVNGIVGLDKMPWHQEGVVGADALRIFLPHLISYEDVMSVYKGKPMIDPAYIIKTIQESNKKVIAAIEEYNQNTPVDKQYNLERWGIVQPALARLNSEPEVIYQIAMVRYHSEVQEVIKSIKAWK